MRLQTLSSALVIALGLAACTKQPPEPNAPAPVLVPQPETRHGKQHIPNIDGLSLAEVKGYYDECMKYKNIGHELVPYVIEDCRAIRARWDRRDMTKRSHAKAAPTLPTLK
jgi:hypothetical protein